MATPRILASSGGFMNNGVQGVMRPAGIFKEAMRLTGKDRPRVCFVMTATGDDKNYLTMSYEALNGVADVCHLSLFTQPTAEIEERLCGSDIIWVGGGSVANLLAVWRVHGVDEVMKTAWEKGVILGGVSAGSICWHMGGTTDSFGPELKPITNGLNLLPYGNGVHYDSEAQRRPLLHSLVADGTLPLSYATDDRIAILYEGTEPVRVIADRDDYDLETGPAAYRIELVGGEVVETRYAAGANIN
ncbi:MAG: peptidase E [Actinobacteria bacterium]|nr:peptidase E [Actinomycetota bacterium]